MRVATFTMVVVGLLVATSVCEGKKKKKKGVKSESPEKDEDDGSKSCDVKWDFDSEDNKDLVCAACQYVMHEVQTTAMLTIRKHHKKTQRKRIAQASVQSACDQIAQRKMAFHGAKPDREFIDWLKQLGRGMEELRGSVCMGPDTQVYIKAACERYTSMYPDDMVTIIGNKKYVDLRRHVCEKMEGKCDPPDIEEDTEEEAAAGRNKEEL